MQLGDKWILYFCACLHWISFLLKLFVPCLLFCMVICYNYIQSTGTWLFARLVFCESYVHLIRAFVSVCNFYYHFIWLVIIYLLFHVTKTDYMSLRIENIKNIVSLTCYFLDNVKNELICIYECFLIALFIPVNF